MDQDSGQVKLEKQSKPWLVIVIIFVLIGGIVAGFFVFKGKTQEGSSNTSTANSINGNGSGMRTGDKTASSESSDIRWEMTNDGSYRASGTAPDCPTPLALASPTDLSKVVSILYPGQTRGGDYKPHGGFRFADGANEETVTAPMDASVIDGGRYLVNGEIQYVFDFVNSCGIKYRLGHLRTLSPTFVTLANQFPEAQEMDSRTTQINSSVKVKTGDSIATAVGLLGEGNAFFDFGVYDLRQENEASKNPTFQAAHANDRDQAWHGVCWFDLLSAENKTIVKGLPATSPGSQSDYCK